MLGGGSVAMLPPNVMTQPAQPVKRAKAPMVIITALLVLLLIAAGSAAFFYYRASNSNKPGTTVQTSRDTNASTSTSSTSSLTPTTVPPTIGAGTMLYSEDGSDNWKGWSGSADWKTLNGALLNDGSYDTNTIAPTITAPYQVEGTSDYAVEAKINIQRQNQGKSVTSAFGITVRGATNGGTWQGYFALISAPGANEPQAAAFITNNNTNFESSILAKCPFDPGTDVHTYRVEVKGNDIKLLIDGSLKVETQDNQFLTGSQVGMISYNDELTVSSFSITAL
jgi:hypothetical protein